MISIRKQEGLHQNKINPSLIFTRKCKTAYCCLLHAYLVKIPNFMFYGGCEHKITTFYFIFWTWIVQSFEIQLQKNSPTFDKLTEVKIN